MTIILTFTNVDVTQQQVKYEEDVVEIDINTNRIASINLTPLSTCTKLRVLSLDLNQLQSLDLTPLSACTSLQSLSLCINELQSLDLTPLASCTNLQAILLHNNQLQSLDLTPLATCTSLKNLSLHGNPLFISGAKYSWLKLGCAYKQPASIYPWSFLHFVNAQFISERRIQRDILCSMGLKNYGFVDCDLSNLFSSIPAETPFETAREQVREYVLGVVITSVDQEGPTTGFSLKDLSFQHGEIAKRAHKIVNLRKTEIERVRVGIQEKEVDLRELYLTAYGYEILTALEMRLTTDLEGLAQIRRALAELGFKLKTGESSFAGVQMSDELKQAIWWIAENRERPWSEIEKGFS